MRAIIIAGFVLLAVSLFYLATGVVWEEGGFGISLVLKPTLGLGWAFGGGETGSWLREHPGMPAPWWLSGPLHPLAEGDLEEGSAPWLTPYFLGLLATPVLWTVWALACGLTWLRARARRRTP